MVLRNNIRVVVSFFYMCFFSISSVEIVNNAYSGISISVSENIEEQHFDFEKLKTVLEDSSKLLYDATKKRSYFGEFIVALPSSWSAKMCEEFTAKAPQKVDIYLTDAIDGTDLDTKHSRECGAEGDLIYMPQKWLSGNTADLSRQFVQQWAVYRYGVFEEEPTKQGSCFYSKKSWSAVGCYNVKVESEIEFENGVPVCYLPPDFSERTDLQSSLMSKANFSKALRFCDGSASFPHNPVMPTLHNNLCEGKTVWSVIENAKDFKYAKNLPMNSDLPPVATSFKCFREERMQLTFAIQNNTIGHDLSKAMIELGSSLFHFLRIMAPPDIAANVVMFSNDTDNSKSIKLNIMDAERLSSQIAYHVKTFEPINNTCLSCGLQKALQASQEERHSSPIVIIIAWESALIGEKPFTLVETIRQYPPSVRLHLILVENTDAEILPSALVGAVRSTGGLIYSLPKEPIFMASKLHVILAGILRSTLQVEDKIVVVHEGSFKKISSHFEDAFDTLVDPPSKLLYLMYCDSEDTVLKQKNSNCSSLLGNSNLIFGSIKCGEVTNFSEGTTLKKTWKYPVEYLGGTVPTNCSSVAVQRLLSSKKNLFTLRGWLNEYVIKVGRNALIVYAEVMGPSESKFRVEAEITGPGLTSPVIIELRDNGNGDPDMKVGDGIYSRYFTSFSSKGTYAVSISAEYLGSISNNLVQEVVNEQQNPKQSKIIGFFSVTETVPNIDIIPPNRVADLSVVAIDHENSTVILQWTAPGDDYDNGTATTYEIKYATHAASLSNPYFDEADNLLQTTGSITPSLNGKIETYEFEFQKIYDSRLYYIALRAVDAYGNKGKTSNTVQIYLNHSLNLTTRKQISSTELTKFITLVSTLSSQPTSNGTGIYTESDESSSTFEEDTISTPTPDDSFFDKNVTIVLSSAGGILFLIIIINAIVCCFCFKRSRHPKTPSRNSSLRQPYNLNIAYQDECNSSSQTENDLGTPMSSLANHNLYKAPQVTDKETHLGYSYHTSKSLLKRVKSQADPELGFRVVKTLPAYGTRSLSQYARRAAEWNDDESETDPDMKAVAQPQKPTVVSDAQVYPLGIV